MKKLKYETLQTYAQRTAVNTNIFFYFTRELMRFPRLPLCAGAPSAITRPYTNIVFGVLENRQERATHVTTRAKWRLN